MNNENVMTATIDDVDELYHYGVPGMKWGVRRTPAQLGHNPPSKKRMKGAKKYVESLIKQRKNAIKVAKDAKKIDKAAKKAEAEERKKNSATKKKSIEEMSDEELAKYVNRKNAERMALTLDRDINALQPEKVSAGKKFANGIMEKATSAIGEGISNAARSLLANAVDKALGQGAYDPLNKLKKEAEKAGYQKKIAEAIQEGVKADRERYNFERQRKGDNEKDAAAKAKADADARKANAERSKWEYTQGRESWKTPSYERNSSWKETSATSSSRSQTSIAGYLSAPASSTSSSTRQLGQASIAGYLPAPASSATGNSRAISLGQSYIAGYLPAPKDDD